MHPVALIMTSLYIKPTCGRKNIYTTWYFREYFDDIINNSKGKYFKKEENETEDITETSFNLKCKFNTGSENKTINLKKKNFDTDNEQTYSTKIKNEIDDNDKINIKYKNGSLKAEIEDDNGNDFIYLGKQPLHPFKRLRCQVKKDNNEDDGNDK